MRRANRVVVTGMGAIAANGTGNQAFWSALSKGTSGIRLITQFDTSQYPIRIAGEVLDFDLKDFVGPGVVARRLARHTQFAIAAVSMAQEQARISISHAARSTPVALIVGVSTSAFDVIERGKERMERDGPTRVSPYFVESSQPHGMASALARVLNIQARCQTISSACASGLEAIAQSASLIRDGKFDVVISGGSDATVTPLAVASFITAGMLPTDSADPAMASRPFDMMRSGGIVAEGCAMFVIENLTHALARGAEPLAEIVGHGSIIDEPGARPGSGLEFTMRAALANAGRYPTQIQYICAHGPSDRIQDEVETEAIKNVFGPHAYRIPVSSIKGAIGNPLSAAGPLELAASILAIQHGAVPPTANYTFPDPKCDLDYVPQRARPYPLQRAMINAHGMGGMNSTLIIERGNDL